MGTFLDSLTAACSSLWAKKVRSMLSILGIIIGILTVASLLTIAFGVRKEIGSYINDLGANLLVVLPGDVSGGGDFSSQFGASTLTEADLEAIRIHVPQARNLNAAMLIAGAVKSGTGSLPAAFILAGSPGVDQTFNLKLARGRFLTADDEVRHARLAVLGSGAAEKLFGASEALGQRVEIRSESYEVVGLLKEVTSATTLGGPDTNSLVLMPLSTGWEVTATRQIFRISLQAPTPDDIEPMKQRIEEVILANHRGEKDFSVLSQDDILALTNDILGVITAMVGAIAAISLVVGGIGIMNIMLVTVNERTREIGIRKAVGATRSVIMLQFLIESILLTLIAGLIAVGMFSAVVLAIQSHVPIPLDLDPFVLGLAILFSIVAGVVFGMIPAYQASRKDPIEALRYE